VLAAHVASLRDRAKSGAAVELLWRSGDVLLELAKLIGEISGPGAAPINGIGPRCQEAVAAVTKINTEIDGLALVLAQSHDVASQTADSVVKALESMSEQDVTGIRFSIDDLIELYVCDAQHVVHQEVLRVFDDAVSGTLTVDVATRLSENEPSR
jgi:hypothetical protein